MPRTARASRAAPAAAKTSTTAPADRSPANPAATVPARRSTSKRPAAKAAPAPVPTVSAATAATTAPAAAPATLPAPAPAPASKRKKPKLVRDGFTMPEPDYALLATLKKRALQAGREVKKSELLRAGLRALAAMPEAAYLGALEGVERIKPGRPAAD